MSHFQLHSLSTRQPKRSVGRQTTSFLLQESCLPLLGSIKASTCPDGVVSGQQKAKAKLHPMSVTQAKDAGAVCKLHDFDFKVSTDMQVREDDTAHICQSPSEPSSLDI